MMLRMVLAALLLLAAPPASVSAQGGPCPGVAHPLRPYASEVLTVSSAALGFTASVYAVAGHQGPEAATLTVEVTSLRYEADGVTTPTSTVGHLMGIGTYAVCGGDTIRAMRMIRVTTDSTVTVTYFR